MKNHNSNSATELRAIVNKFYKMLKAENAKAKGDILDVMLNDTGLESATVLKKMIDSFIVNEDGLLSVSDFKKLINEKDTTSEVNAMLNIEQYHVGLIYLIVKHVLDNSIGPYTSPLISWLNEPIEYGSWQVVDNDVGPKHEFIHGSEDWLDKLKILNESYKLKKSCNLSDDSSKKNNGVAL